LNNISIVGRLVRDPELRTTSTGKQVCSFCVAVDRANKKDGSDFFECQVWDKSAEFVSSYGIKGRLTGVWGEMQCREFVDKEGAKRKAWELKASRVTFLDRPREDGNEAPKAKTQIDDEYDPFAED